MTYSARSLFSLPLFVLILTVALLVPGVPGTSHAEDLTIAAYNAKNLFDVFDDPYTEDEKTQVKSRQEIEALAGAIKYMEADVVAFSEIENEHVLKAMISEFLPDEGYQFIAASNSNSGRGINLGIVSRKPILSVTSHRFGLLTIPSSTRVWSFARDLWQVKLRINDDHVLNLFIVHFKSRRDSSGDPNSGKWRLAEAMEARRIVEQVAKAHPKEWYAIVGDFNDTPDNPPIKHLLDEEAGLLVDVHASLKPKDRITYLHEPYRSTIDYIMTCPRLAKRLKPGSAEVMTSYSMMRGSDHAPIWATFDVSGK